MSIVKMHVDEKEYSCCVYLCLDRYKPKQKNHVFLGGGTIRNHENDSHQISSTDELPKKSDQKKTTAVCNNVASLRHYCYRRAIVQLMRMFV